MCSEDLGFASLVFVPSKSTRELSSWSDGTMYLVLLTEQRDTETRGVGKEETFDKIPLQREDEGGLSVLLLLEIWRAEWDGSGSDFLSPKELPATGPLFPKLFWHSSFFCVCISESSCLLVTREVVLAREMGGRVRAAGL